LNPKKKEQKKPKGGEREGTTGKRKKRPGGIVIPEDSKAKKCKNITRYEVRGKGINEGKKVTADALGRFKSTDHDVSEGGRLNQTMSSPV